MSYYIPTSTCGGGTQSDYACGQCIETEHGRIRSVAIVKTSYVATLMAANTALDSTWTTALSTGNIFALYATQGSYDGGTTAELVGFGNQATMNGNTTHIAQFKDPFYADNCDFWNDLRNSSEYTFCYVTENYVHFGEETATWTPKNPVADDINSNLTWDVQAKWTNPDSPCPYAKPASFFDSCAIHS